MLSDEQFLKRFKRLKRRRGGQYRAECPSHDDSTPSLDILILPDRRSWVLAVDMRGA